MTKLNVKPLTPEDISEAMRHFRKIVLEGKKPTNNLQMIDINLIVLKLKSLRKHSKKQLQKLKNAIKKQMLNNSFHKCTFVFFKLSMNM